MCRISVFVPKTGIAQNPSSLIPFLNVLESKRIGMSLEEYTLKVNPMWVSFGSDSVKDIFALVLTRIKAISFAAHKSRTGIASASAVTELNVYDDLLQQSIAKFNEDTPHSFFKKFKKVPFVDDAGVGKRKKKMSYKRTNYKKKSNGTKSKKNKKGLPQ